MDKLKKVVSFSGGRTSAYLCKLMKDMYGDNVDFVYMDTGMEHPKTYEFIRNVNNKFNLNLTCIKIEIKEALGDGGTYKIVDIDSLKWDLTLFGKVIDKHGVPYNPGGAYCTDRMKFSAFKKYAKDLYGKNYETFLGIRADEPKRLVGNEIFSKLIKVGVDSSEICEWYRSELKGEDYYDKGEFLIANNEYLDIREDFKKYRKSKWKKNIRHLAEFSDVEKEDVINYWREQDFDLDISGEHLGNCVFCIKKGVNKIALAAKQEPELAKDFLSILSRDSVRTVETRTTGKLVMYRGKKTFGEVIEMFKEHTVEELQDVIKGRKQEDTNSCSESCEVFSGQMDMFANA